MTSKPSENEEKLVDDLVFYGKMGAGKTTASEYVVKAFGYQKLSIAQTLKDAAVRVWGPDVLQDRDKLQKLGKALREIDENALFSGFEQEYTDCGVPIVNDDLRYPNEWWKLKELGFIFIEVTAPEDMRIDRLQKNGKLSDLAQLKDETETALDSNEFQPDYTIPNEVDQAELENLVDDVIYKIESKT